MTLQRMIIEMGTGNDQYGQDYTKAAARAIEDAIRHAALPIFESIGLAHEAMEVRVTVAVQAPERVDTTALAAGLPRGRASVRAVFGGLDVTNPDTGTTLVVATAAVEAFVPAQPGWHQSGT
ncbi:MAG: Lin0512 family protein [Rhodobacteraceae bacterium]|nr:Lin0512 family protein [Paracoccaceae bacterium]